LYFKAVTINLRLTLHSSLIGSALKFAITHNRNLEDKLKSFKWILLAKPEGNKPLGKTSCRWEDNIKMYLTERELEAADWTPLTQVRDKCQSLVNAVVIALNMCQYVATVTSKAQTRNLALVPERAKQRKSSHSFEWN